MIIKDKKSPILGDFFLSETFLLPIVDDRILGIVFLDL
jgi:hypothetical protein